jgi:hypothetical protein
MTIFSWRMDFQHGGTSIGSWNYLLLLKETDQRQCHVAGI